MNRHRYPREQPPSWRNANKYDMQNKHGCATCKTPFIREQLICFVETQVSWFRGDDEVDYYCLDCASLRGYRTPKAIRQKTATEELEAIRRNMAKPGGDTPGRRKKLAELEAQVAEAAPY